MSPSARLLLRIAVPVIGVPVLFVGLAKGLVGYSQYQTNKIENAAIKQLRDLGPFETLPERERSDIYRSVEHACNTMGIVLPEVQTIPDEASGVSNRMIVTDGFRTEDLINYLTEAADQQPRNEIQEDAFQDLISDIQYERDYQTIFARPPAVLVSSPK